ncbi:hypothetical protein MGYG_04999 [Nannizzia gypsea CBS 118893]|uniref:Uncharacterized protein n=1 Tax=Arthroderma gypseum (strain ATCC MYA-4604 / CBS 118893) TaxID=535722 RepID=E4UY03_ARTGP|nr:hypothetical protein MGYG_04999 [Nannizzia gypsea CBS 118893]EFR01996.1 hypothetical protein MGYG_04999 [Nannizzia gypsea CBS 118893]
MEPGATYVQKLASGKVGFVRRPIKIKPTKSILADAFLPNRDGSSWSFPYTYSPGAHPVDPVEVKETHQPIPLTDGPAQTHNYGREYQLATRKFEPAISNLYHRDAALLPPPAPSPILEPQSPTYSRAHAAPAAETRHRCAVCGRYRSPSYQYRHPIIPGQIPPTSVCRKCRFTYTSSGESTTESDDTERRPRRGRRHSRRRRSRSRPVLDKEHPTQPSPIPQILQAPAPPATQAQEPPNPTPPVLPPPPHPQPQVPVTKIESSPNIFHFCPNPPGLCTFRRRGNSHDYGLPTPSSSPHCCAEQSYQSLPDYRDTCSSCCYHRRSRHHHHHQYHHHNHCYQRDPRLHTFYKSGSFDEVQVVPPDSARRSYAHRESSALRQADQAVVKDASSWSRPANGNWDDSNDRVRRPRSPTPSPSPVRDRRRVEPRQLSSSLRDTRPPQAKVCRFASDEPQDPPNVQYQTWNNGRLAREYSRTISRRDDNNEGSGWYDAPDYERQVSTRPSRNASIQRRPSQVNTERAPSEILFVPKPRRQFEAKYRTYQPKQQWDYESLEREPESRFKEYQPSNPRRTAVASRRSHVYPVVRDEQEEEDAAQGYSDPTYEKWNNNRHNSHGIIEGPRGTYNPQNARNPSGHQYKTQERSVVW